MPPAIYYLPKRLKQYELQHIQNKQKHEHTCCTKIHVDNYLSHIKSTIAN